MSAFAGEELPAELAARLARDPVAGFTLFRQHNVANNAQLRALTGALQAAARPDARPLLIAADQEGGQLIGMGDETTQFAGAMALGAVADDDLAERVGRAVGRELRALGINVNYASVCDLATNPANPGLGIRSFGDDPVAAGRLAAATVRGLQAEGVAATAKHFPGNGDGAVDTHDRLAVVRRSRPEFGERELVPFRAALAAGARLVMSGHFALPEVTGDESLPATLSSVVMTDLLRGELSFDGLAITDALDMKALAQGGAQIVDVIAALRAGQDLLLGTADPLSLDMAESGVRQALLRGLVDPGAIVASAQRLATLRAWLATFEQPDLAVVGCTDHVALAQELAARSVTLVRNDERLLPLRPPNDGRVAVIMPSPADVTRADTSSYVAPGLATAIRRRHPATDEFVTGHRPAAAEIAALRSTLGDYDVLVVATLCAHSEPAQAEMVAAVLSLDVPTITLALRTPWDLDAYSNATTHACSYGILPPTIEALAAALFGEMPFAGHLPVSIAGLYERGHGLVS
ncbi:MAG: glycoside hydrolase family 3 protein [Chloroflexota bacterium]|nr:glycoside hydrolase family 3 protein [Chloroflexota bacterium]